MEILVLKLESSGIPRYCRAGGEEAKGQEKVVREDGQRESERKHCLKQGSQSPGARKADLPCDSET